MDTVSNFLNVQQHTEDCSGPEKNTMAKLRKPLPILLLAIVVIAVIGILVVSVRPKTKTADERVTVQGPRATATVNRDFLFPVKDSKGTEVTKLKYTLEDAQLRDEIIVQGQRAVAVKGRTFLILNIKLTNSYKQAFDINAKDYVRLTVNGKDTELLAADIHNDPVTIQPQSTKATRLGFPVNDTDGNMKLFVGELNGKKETVTLSFH